MKVGEVQIKIGAIQELGSKYDDMREAAHKDVARKEGFQAALNEVQQSTLRSIFERVDVDRELGKFDLSAAALIKEYLAKVHAALDNLRAMNEKHRLIAEGRIVGLSDAVNFAKKALDGENARLATLEGRFASGVGPEPENIGTVRPDVQSSALGDLNERRCRARAAKQEQQHVGPPPAPPVESKPSRGRPKGSRNRPKEESG